MTTLEIILTAVSSLLAGGNLLQLLQLRSVRRKSAEEANQASSESWRLIVQGNVNEIERLQARLDAADRRVAELTEIVYELRIKIANDEKVINTARGNSATHSMRKAKNHRADSNNDNDDRERQKTNADG